MIPYFFLFLLTFSVLQGEEGLIAFSQEQMQKSSISLVKAAPTQLTMTLSTRGKIEVHPDCYAHILPASPGIAHSAFKVVGDPVQQGEVMALLESSAVAEVKGAFLLAQEKACLAKEIFDKEQSLYNKRISSQFEYLKAKSAYETAKIDLLLLEQKLQAYGFRPEELSNDSNLRLYPIRSPLNGVVLARHITQGEYIEKTAKIYEVADLSKVWVEMGIPPKDLNRIQVGQSVKIFEDNLQQTGRLIYVSPVIHDASVATKAIAELDNSQGNWRPGGYVQAVITTKTIPIALGIPKNAIQEIDGEKVVFVHTPNGFQKKVVEVGLSDLATAEIKKGITHNDQIAATNTFLLKAELGKGSGDDDD